MKVVESLGIDNFIIVQDDTLYRFTSDAVILSKFAKAKKGDVVADFCSGSGIVGIHFYALNKNIKSCDLIELQKELSDMSEESVQKNGLSSIFTVINKPIQQLDSSFGSKYTLILCNPPYKKRGSGEVCPNNKIAMCKHEITVTQEEIVSVASKKLQPGGRLCMCQRIERFTDLIVCMQNNKIYPSKLQFVCTKTNKEPYLFLIEGVKSKNVQLKVLENYVNGES